MWRIGYNDYRNGISSEDLIVGGINWRRYFEYITIIEASVDNGIQTIRADKFDLEYHGGVGDVGIPLFVIQ